LADFGFACFSFAFAVVGFAELFAASLAVVAAVACIAAAVFGTGVTTLVASDAANETEAKLAATAIAVRILIDFMENLLGLNGFLVRLYDAVPYGK
jgi:hypothetical protein